jgi:RNA polymerase sigma factor (TIGR02999 family)
MADTPDQAVTTITQVLNAARGGDRRAAAELLPLVYEELRSLARARMAKLAPGETLEPTALVHEAYLRVVGSNDPGWDSRGHFFAAAAQAMRNILVDQARRKGSIKHGGAHDRLDLRDVELAIEPPSADILALDDALKELEQTDPRKAQIVMLHHFGGLTLEETAAALDVSLATVQRQWRFTRAALFTLLAEEKPPPG